jgi:cytochrome c oxidase subunit 1
VHNFDEIPSVHALDEHWHRKYVEDERTGRLVPAQAGAANGRAAGGAAGHDTDGHGAERGIHLPGPSYWPVVAALGMPVIGYGVLYSWWLVGIGFLIALVGFYGWAMEPSVASGDA